MRKRFLLLISFSMAVLAGQRLFGSSEDTVGTLSQNESQESAQADTAPVQQAQAPTLTTVAPQAAAVAPSTPTGQPLSADSETEAQQGSEPLYEKLGQLRTEQKSDLQGYLRKLDEVLQQLPQDRFSDRVAVLDLLPELRKEQPDYVAEIAGRELEVLLRSYEKQSPEERKESLEQLSEVFELQILSERDAGRRESFARDFVGRMPGPLESSRLRELYLSYFSRDQRAFDLAGR